MKKTLIFLLTFICLLPGVFSSALAFEKKVVLGENFGATW